MNVAAHPPPGKSVERGDFADLTDTPVKAVGWGAEGEGVVVEFAEPVPDDVAEKVRRRIMSRDELDESLRTASALWLDWYAGWQAIAEPTQEQKDEALTLLLDQVANLTRIIDGR